MEVYIESFLKVRCLSRDKYQDKKDTMMLRTNELRVEAARLEARKLAIALKNILWRV